MISSRLLIPVLASAFILGGLLQFLPNPDLDPIDVPLDPTHNLLHILAGIALWIGGHLGHRRNTILGTGLAFLVIAIVGSLASGDIAAGVARIDATDHWFHAMLALLLFVVAMITTPDDTRCAPCDPVLQLPPRGARRPGLLRDANAATRPPITINK